MMHEPLYRQAVRVFREKFGREPAVAAYAPGRIEVLGNHTDYNEGFVLSAAIDCGTFFLAAPSGSDACRLVPTQGGRDTEFDINGIEPSADARWSNYVRGVLAGLKARGGVNGGMLGLVMGNVPLGSGLSSSAALEMSSGLALAALYGMTVDPIDMAKIGQKAEHTFAGVKCGLLDQVTSLFAKEAQLVMTDFRSLHVESVPMGADVCFLMCNTHAKHALVDGEYNERRAKCEEAAKFFASVLPHPVKALRDVSWEEWQQWSDRMDPVAAKRAAHVVGENTRVLAARKLLSTGHMEDFGKLMFESHDSSIFNFQNSCRELDAMVEIARTTPGVLGARLSGGGFGGSVAVLVRAAEAETIAREIEKAYNARFATKGEVSIVKPSAGATLVRGEGG